MSEVTARALARSSLHMNAVQVALMVSRLVLTPIVIARLGLEGYGVWVLLFSLCATATALNSGVIWAHVKLTAELDEHQDYPLMSQVVSSSAALMATFSVAMLGMLWLASASVLPRIGVPLPLLSDATRVLATMTLAAFVETGPGCAMHVLAGLQRMDLQYRLKMAGMVTELATTLLLLAIGYGMASLASGYLAGQLLCAGGARIACRRMRPALEISLLRVSRTGLRQLMPLGFRLQGVVLLNTVAREGVRLSIASLFGAAALGTYQLADRVLLVARFPALALASPLMPAFSSLAARGQTEKGHRLFGSALTVTAVASALCLLFAVVFADAILLAWTGHELPDAAWTVRILAPAEFAPALTGVAVAALRASGAVGLELRFAFAASVLALAGIAIGSPIAGYAGCMLAVAVARCAAGVSFLLRLPRLWTSDGGEYLRRTLCWSVALVAPIVLAAKLAALGFAPSTGRWQTLALLLVLAGGSALAVAVLAWVFVLTKPDRVALLRKG